MAVALHSSRAIDHDTCDVAVYWRLSPLRQIAPLSSIS